MSAIDDVFAACRAEKRAAFIPYVTGGDPDLATTPLLLRTLADAGADLIEVGVPFSDPIADGPVNQRAASRALSSGAHLGGILGAVAETRQHVGTPIVLFTYLNPLLAYRLPRFAEQAKASGVDGVLCVDLPPEEAKESYLPLLREAGLDTVFLAAPTSGWDRVKVAGAASSGFLYYVSSVGVTGERETLPGELTKQLKRVRRRVELPVAVGFGVSTVEQAAALARVADGVVVGSAIVRMLEGGVDEEVVRRVGERARQLAEAMRR